MAYRTVLSKGEPVQYEFEAGGTITPGMLVKIGTDNKAVVHPTAAGNAEKLFALENKNVGKDIADDYASGDQVLVGAFHSGQEVIARIENGENIAIGQALESNGAGFLQAHVLDSTGIYYHDVIVGYAAEAKDMSGSDLADPSNLCRVRIA